MKKAAATAILHRVRTGLVSLQHNGVTPAFVRQVREAGYREVTPQALVEMKRRGIGTAARGGAPR